MLYSDLCRKAFLIIYYLINFLAAVEVKNVQRPHVVFILADDLGWNDVGFHGSAEIPTPNLDALAYDGIILSNYYVQPLCTPTRAALLTGRYPSRFGLQHGVLSSAQPYGLPLNETLLPQYLKQLNYSTHIVGKWHPGFFAKEYLPTRRGFDSHYAYYQGCGDYFDHTYAPDAPYDLKSWGLDFHRDEEIERTSFGQYSTEIFTSEAVNIIQRHNDSSKPLFLYLAHQAVHSGTGGTSHPLEAPQKYIDRVSHIKHPTRRLYAAMVSALDESVGNVTKALHDRGMLNNTILIFSSDNGGPANGYNYNNANNWPLRGMKNTLWEGGVRGASFIWSPWLKNSGYISDHLMHVTDWLPTILHTAGYKMSDSTPLDGVNQWEALSNNEPSRRTEILHNYDPKSKAFAVRDGDFKLVFDVKGNTKQYDDWYKPDDITDKLSEIKNLSKTEMMEWKLHVQEIENFLLRVKANSTGKSGESSNHSVKNLHKRNTSEETTDDQYSNIFRLLESINRGVFSKNTPSYASQIASPFIVNCSSDIHKAYDIDNDDFEKQLIGSNAENVNKLYYSGNIGQNYENYYEDNFSAYLRSNNLNSATSSFQQIINIRNSRNDGRANKKDCNPDKFPCLFDISKDPCETHNLANKHPEIVNSLLKKVEYYRSISVDPINKPVDEQGLPYHHNRLWVPWVNLDLY